MEPGSPWGVSEKLSESCKDNFAGAGSGSMGMRLDELANSSFFRRGNWKGIWGGEEMRWESKKIQVSFESGKTMATWRARGNLFWVKLMRSLQEIGIGVNWGVKPWTQKREISFNGRNDLYLIFPLPYRMGLERTCLVFSDSPYTSIDATLGDTFLINLARITFKKCKQEGVSRSI